MTKKEKNIQNCTHEPAKSLLAKYKKMGIMSALCSDCGEWIKPNKLAKAGDKLLTAGATMVVLFGMIIGAPIYLLIAIFRPDIRRDLQERENTDHYGAIA